MCVCVCAFVCVCVYTGKMACNFNTIRTDFEMPVCLEEAKLIWKLWLRFPAGLALKASYSSDGYNYWWFHEGNPVLSNRQRRPVTCESILKLEHFNVCISSLHIRLTFQGFHGRSFHISGCSLMQNCCAIAQVPCG
jgi:hypothetical protein